MHSDKESSMSVVDGFFMESSFGQGHGQSHNGSYLACFKEWTAPKGVLCGSYFSKPLRCGKVLD